MQDGEIRGQAAGAAFSDQFTSGAVLRLLVFADDFGASQSLAFVEGLRDARFSGRAAVRVVEESVFGADSFSSDPASIRRTVEAHVAQTEPTAVALSRFGHSAAYEAVRAAASARGLPVLFHIDDDLFDVPLSAGIERYRSARHPRRLRTLERGLREADLVIAATPALGERLAASAGHARIGWLENGTAGEPRPRPPKPKGEPVVIGYMGSASHDADLEMAIPALNAALATLDDARVELFGSITRQSTADRLPLGIARHDMTAGDYAAFKHRLASLGWDIGLAPLHDTAYNRCKTATKWVEYAEAGIATVVSDVEVYRPMIEAGAALAARPDQWQAAVGRLSRDEGLRADIVGRANALLAARYGWARLEASVTGLIERALGPGARLAA
jgi:glycosyltransferase involved in cell wall biosynthesis